MVSNTRDPIDWRIMKVTLELNDIGSITSNISAQRAAMALMTHEETWSRMLDTLNILRRIRTRSCTNYLNGVGVVTLELSDHENIEESIKAQEHAIATEKRDWEVNQLRDTLSILKGIRTEKLSAELDVSMFECPCVEYGITESNTGIPRTLLVRDDGDEVLLVAFDSDGLASAVLSIKKSQAPDVAQAILRFGRV